MLAYSYLRLSSREQLTGDGIRRQVEMRDALLKEKGLSLDTSFVLADRGVSAFRGKNKRDGALGQFLAAVHDGRVKRGSVLIVESLDRLSREEVDEALATFLSILRAGVSVITLSPRYEFAGGKADMTSLIIAIVEMGRAHSESAIKSERARANWDAKRRTLADKVMTSRCPCWLRVVDGRFELIEDKAETVRLIFEMAAKGYGTRSIAGKFNKEGRPAISKARSWQDSFVWKILSGRQAVGEFQPMVSTFDSDKKKTFVPVGEPVKNYYPPVVTEAAWQAAQQARKRRQFKQSGRVSAEVGNLFTGLLWAADGFRMRYLSRGPLKWLVPESSHRGLASGQPTVQYQYFEHVMLNWCEGLGLTLGESSEYEALRARKAALEKSVAALRQQVRQADDVESLLGLLVEKERELTAVSKAVESAVLPKQNQLVACQSLIRMLRDADASEREDLRRQLRAQIANVIRRVTITVGGKFKARIKTVHVWVQFTDGQEQGLGFTCSSAGVLSGWTTGKENG